MDAPPLPPNPPLPSEPALDQADADLPPTVNGAPPLPNDAAPPPLPTDNQQAELPLPPEEDEDPLIVAQREQEEREQALQEAANIHQEDDPALKVIPTP